MCQQLNYLGMVLKNCFSAFVVFIFVFVYFVYAEHRESHFGNPCKLCGCFIEYTHRDIAIPTVPYRVAKNPYNSTEDRCLATCLHDDRCKLAVYGYVGGREIFTCEFYDEVNLKQPIYTPFTNIYFKRQTLCDASAHKYTPLWTVEGDESVIARKSRYIKLALQQNPFNFG